MTTMQQKTEHLQEHLPYELLMLRHTYGRIASGRYALDWNAYYESFVVHARNLFVFLNSEGTSNNLKADDFAEQFRPTKDQVVRRIINQDLQTQVFHFGKKRASIDEDKISLCHCKKLLEWIESNFITFFAQMHPTLKQHWNADCADPYKVHEEIMKQEEEQGSISVKITNTSAVSSSSGGVKVVRLWTGPGPGRPDIHRT